MPSSSTATANGSSNAGALLSTYEEIAWEITVDGKPIQRLLSFRLEQRYSAHHRFELRVYHTELEDPRTYRIERTKDLLGKPVTAMLGTHVQPDVTRFAGIITEVAFEEKTGLYGEVILSGYSPTILLEGGAHLRSFLDKNLQAIVSDTLQGVKGGLPTSVRPRHSANIEYTAQYRESDFAFLTRLAALHGEWFLYDGQTLHFGRPGNRGGATELQYARHIEKLRMGMQAVPVHAELTGYRAQEDQKLAAKAGAGAAGLNYYGDAAVAGSERMFRNAARQTPRLHAFDQGSLDRIAITDKAAAAAQMFRVEGVSRHPAPRPGLALRVMMGPNELGEYLVTEAVHELDNVNKYRCTFTALASEMEVLPNPPGLALPAAGAQVATVTDNADPAGQGRVQVQMLWQEEDNTTPWIRVMTPDAGSSEAVSTNRGYVFIPEVGDQVMVDFENGNPDAPFVLGSLFHGNNGTGGGGGNITKSISTRSGHTIELDDGGSGTHIIIRDPGGNEIYLDTVGRNIIITAPETITLEAKNIRLSAEQSITATAGINISESAGMHIMQNAGDSLHQYAVNDYRSAAANIISIATEAMDVQARSIEESSEDMRMDSSKEPMVFNSAKTVDVKSAEKSKLF